MTARLNGQELPEGWAWTQMNFVCQKVQDGTHFSPQVQYEQPGPGRYLYITAKNVRYGRLDLSNVTYIDRNEHESIFDRCNPEEGDVLLTKDGVNTGVAAINHLVEPFSLLSSVALLKPYRNILDSRFLMHYLHSPIGSEMITGQMTGTAIKRIILRRIKEAPICVAPLNEQHRIVAAIETHFTRLDAAVTALKRSQANLKRYRAAVLKAACEGRLVPTEAALAQAEGRSYEPASVLLERILTERRRKWEAENPKRKYQEPVAPDTSALPELPEGWCWATVDGVTSHITSGSRGWADYYSQDGAIFIRAQDINTDELVLDNVAHVDLPNSVEGIRTQVRRHDLLVTITGANVTKTALVKIEIDDAYVNQHVGLVRPVETNCSTYLYLWIISPLHGRKQLEKYAYGAGKPGLNLTNIREVVVALPPLAEQQRIVAEVERRLSLIDQLEKTLEADLARANRLRQSILKRAFAGQLVPQDPNDEPASLLLERMKPAKHGQPVQTALL